MYKILTCNCKRSRLDQLEINYTYSFFFEDCHCSTNHEIFGVRGKIYPYNLVGFARNDFASFSCSCVKLNKDTVCHHCVNLRNNLNVETIKICLKKEDMLDEFELINYFYYSKEQNKIDFSLVSLDWGNFFYGKETM